MWKHQFDESATDCRPRNRLSLADRMRAIEAYEKTPIYQKVGQMFNCSAKQIRNIIKNKKKIMALHSSGRKTVSRPKKTETLEKALVEWVLRARRNPNVERLTQDMLAAAALEIVQILRIERFYPDHQWLMKFRETFQITDSDMETPLTGNFGPVSLDIQNIIDFVKEREYVDALDGDLDYTSWNDSVPGWNDDSLASSTLHVPNSVATTSSRASSSSLAADDECPPSKYPKLEPIDVIEIDSDEENVDGSPPNGRKAQRNLPITSIEQALLHLKPLEEFALMKEDFRAIGLISQLEAVLNGTKRKRSSH